MTLREYRFVEKIGEGGYAEVWRAVGPDGRECAVKVPLETSPMFVEAMRDEIGKLLRLVGAPGIVKVLGYHLDGPLPYLVMELAEGNLLKLLDLPADQRTATTLALEIARVVQQAHRRGVIHRDIKPENLLLQRGSIRLTDFGLGKGAESVLLTMGGAGTPGYMAPEQRIGPAFAPADVYGIGATLFHLLTAGRPVDGISGLDPRASVPCGNRLAALVVRMTDADWRNRPTLDQVIVQLSQILRPTPHPSPQHRPTTSGAALGGGLLAVLLGAWAVSTMNHYDRSAGRYRGSDGTFRPGRWG